MVAISKASIQPDEIVSFLKADIQIKEVSQKILHKKVIEKAARERGITLTPEEIQGECDRLRRDKRLEKAADTLAWLADQMISVEDLEAGISDRLLSEKLAKHLFDKDIEKIFAQNRLDFEQVLLYQIVVPYAKLAQELFYQIEEEEISFYQAAHLYDIDESRRHKCGFEGKLYRWNLKPEIAAAVFNAQPGEIVGPVKVEENYHLLMVEEFIPAKLTPEIHQELLDKMFKQWLASELNYMLHSQSE